MPTHDEYNDAMDAVVRLFELRENYAKAKRELDRIESEMDMLQRRAGSVLHRAQTGDAAATENEGEAK